MFTRYELITMLIQSNYLFESDREFIASHTDEQLANINGGPQFICVRPGYYQFK